VEISLKLLYITPLLLAAGLLMPGHALAQKGINPQVSKQLADIAAAYKQLGSFSTTIDTTEKTSGKGQTLHCVLSLKKPKMVSALVTLGRLNILYIADETSQFSQLLNDKTGYVKAPNPSFEAAVQGMVNSSAGGVGVLPVLLTDPNAAVKIVPGKPDALYTLADEVVSGEACGVIGATVSGAGKATRYTFAYAKKDHLLRRVTIGPALSPEKPQLVELYTNVRINPPLANTAFHFTPPPGAIARAPGDKTPSRAPSGGVRVGAAPLPLKGNDMDGRAISLDQYRGKVVLLDFWATWCGPCVAELPNVTAAYQKYHSRGFDVIGISLDKPNGTEKLRAFTQSHGMPWRQIYDGKTNNPVNALAYGVRAIPFTVLIGKDGKIAALSVRGQSLAPAIEAALARK
jgi:peroxiredoxin/outer membrane lipoprotein-sorting protein